MRDGAEPVPAGGDGGVGRGCGLSDLQPDHFGREEEAVGVTGSGGRGVAERHDRGNVLR